MKKTLLSAVMIASFGVAALASMSAQAASTGTISFTGRVLADTCTINVNGSGNNTVALPSVMTTAFGSTVGSVAGATPFTIGLTGCDTNTTSAKMAFNGTQIDATTGNLKNATSGGSNVQIQLLSGAAVINTSTSTNAPTIAVTNGVGSTTLTAQYISTATATTAGLVTSSVGFTLTYQ